MLNIDGSQGEGGGQILRTALGLSLVTGQPFQIEKIRAMRRRPGLQAQHLAAVRAAAAVGHAETIGAEIGSARLTFQPQPATGGDYSFAVGTAGSATLVLQTVLPALLTVAQPWDLVLEGGTHNPMAPPFEFLDKAFLPLLRAMGAVVQAKLDRHGFYPAGGGKIRVTGAPIAGLKRLDLMERGEVKNVTARAVVANLPRLIADRELKILKRDLHLDAADLVVEEARSHGPGNVAFVEVKTAGLTEVLCEFGEKGRRAELVAELLVRQTRQYLESRAPVGEHLADQLLIPMALAGGGSFVTQSLSLHATTNIDVIKMFLPVTVRIESTPEQTVRVELARAG